MAEEFRADPNRAPYNGSRAPFDPAKCKAGVWSQETWSRYSQCARKAAKDGWCKQHHPDAQLAREQASREKVERDNRAWSMGFFGEQFMAALIKIRDGDNDPRATAAEALHNCRYAQKDGAP